MQSQKIYNYVEKHSRGQGKMKTISKILYGILSFSIFAAYKIESAWAGWKLTLSSYSVVSGCSYSDSVFHPSSASSKIKNSARRLTLCSPGDGMLVGCSSMDGTSIAAYGPYTQTTSLITLAQWCEPDRGFACSACPNDGINGDALTATELLKPPADYTGRYPITVCGQWTLTRMANTVHNADTAKVVLPANDEILLAATGDNMLQNYYVDFVPEADDWLSLPAFDNCYLPTRDTDGVQMESGIMVRNQPCPYNNSM